MTRGETRRHLPFIGGLVVAIAAGAMLVMWGDEYAVGVGLTLVMWIALVQSWAAFSGLSGYISLGHAVFYGVGAYIMVAGWQVLPIWLAVIAAGLAAGAIALLLGWPSLRVRGPYFVILTFGLAEFVKYIVVSVEAALGRNGRLLIGTPSLRELFVAMLALAVLSTTTLYALRRSKLGTGLIAIREDEVAAEAVGVNTARTKLVIFGLSAIIPGMVGALMSLRFTYFEPMQSFSPVTSFTIVTIAVLGGSDDVPGPLLGAAFLVALSELLLGESARTLHDHSGSASGRLCAVCAGRHLRKVSVLGQGRRTVSLLRLDDVSKSYGGVSAVRNFSLEVAEGEIVGLMGANGAGKTTAFSLISRHPACYRRRDMVWRRADRSEACLPDQSPWDCADVPDRKTFLRFDRAGKPCSRCDAWSSIRARTRGCRGEVLGYFERNGSRRSGGSSGWDTDACRPQAP